MAADERVPIVRSCDRAMNSAKVRRLVLAVVLVLPVALVACALTVPASAGAVRTARLLPAFFAGLPVDPSGWLAGPIVHETAMLAGDPNGATLHVWRPASGRHPALIVSLGVDPAPPDDPRVVRLFRGIAHAGIVAVLVESSALDQDRLSPAAPDLIVRGFEQTAARPDVEDGHIGLVGFSVGAALVELAAADPRIRDQVAVVEAFGGYARLTDIAAAATTDSVCYREACHPWRPDPTTLFVMRKDLIDGVPSAADRDALTHALLDGDAPLPDPATLTDAGRAVLALLTNTDRRRVDGLLAALPEGERDELEALSPLPVLGEIRAPVFLMHDRGDHLVPYVESRRTRDALVAAGHPPYFSEFDIFRHVEPGHTGSPHILARDGVRLLLHVYWLLRRLG